MKQDENTSIHVQPPSGRPKTALTEQKKERVDGLIKEDRHLTVDDIVRILGVGCHTVQEMIESLGDRNISAHWVPRLLTED